LDGFARSALLCFFVGSLSEEFRGKVGTGVSVRSIAWLDPATEK